MALMLQNKLHAFVARFFPDDIETKYVNAGFDGDFWYLLQISRDMLNQ